MEQNLIEGIIYAINKRDYMCYKVFYQLLKSSQNVINAEDINKIVEKCPNIQEYLIFELLTLDEQIGDEHNVINDVLKLENVNLQLLEYTKFLRSQVTHYAIQ